MPWNRERVLVGVLARVSWMSDASPPAECLQVDVPVVLAGRQAVGAIDVDCGRWAATRTRCRSEVAVRPTAPHLYVARRCASARLPARLSRTSADPDEGLSAACTTTRRRLDTLSAEAETVAVLLWRGGGASRAGWPAVPSARAALASGRQLLAGRARAGAARMTRPRVRPQPAALASVSDSRGGGHRAYPFPVVPAA